MFKHFHLFSIVCAERFFCQVNKNRPGHVLQHTKEFSREQCAKRCCMRTGCVGYDWESDTNNCYLTNKRKVSLTIKAKRWSCEKAPGKSNTFSVRRTKVQKIWLAAEKFFRRNIKKKPKRLFLPDRSAKFEPI